MNKFKIIIWDLETVPDLAAALKVWPQLSAFPGRTIKADLNSIVCFGYKEVSGTAQVKSAWEFPEWLDSVNDDRKLCEFAFNVLKDADAVVTQNGRGFDWKFLQTRLLLHGFPALPRIQHIDTKVLAKSNLLLFSNSLKRMAALFTKERKLENDGWELWERVHARDPEAQQKMAEYCAQDVEATEAVFLELRKFATGLPNHNQVTDEASCPNCGSLELLSNGFRATAERTYRRLVCKVCGTWSKVTVKDKVTRL